MNVVRRGLGGFLLAVFMALQVVAGAQEADEGAIGGLELSRLDPPAPAGLFPHLATGPDGAVHALWTEQVDAGGEGGARAVHRLRTVRFVEGAWGEAATVAEGAGWFVNWADVPRLAVGVEGRLAASWLERLGPGAYAYGVRAAVSQDGGASWSAPSWLHTDLSETEHGFVSLAALADGRFAAVWLDGRNMAGAEQGGEGGHGTSGGHGTGSMTLRAGVIERDGSSSAETELDDQVCDCCPTAMVRLEDGTLVVAYRDRTRDEVRDISVVSGRTDEPSSWSAPRAVHRDGWRIPGCPVNGPVLAARGQELACAWFTMGEDGEPRVLAARSRDGGKSFGAPVRIDGGDPIGRVGLAPLGAAGWAAVWLEQTGPETAEWRARALAPGLEAGAPVALAEVPAGRPSGFPALAPSGEGVLVLWTDVPGPGLSAALLRGR